MPILLRMADVDFHVVAEISHLDYYDCLLLVSALAYLPTWPRGILLKSSQIMSFFSPQLIESRLASFQWSMCAKSLQSCLTLCDSMGHSLPGSSVDGILQTKVLEWVAIPSPRGSS